MEKSKSNKLIAISRWRKILDKEKEFISKNSVKNKYLKARLLGYLAGDGNVSIRRDNKGTIHHEIRFFPDHESLIRPFVEAFEKVYNKTPVLKKLKNHYILRIYSKVSVLDILKSGDLSTLSWSIPLDIIDKQSKKEWLSAFFDSEAYVGKDRITIGSVNKRGIEQIQALLREFNIDSRIYNYKQKNKNWNDVSILIILKREDRMNYLKYIGFNHSLKTEKLKSYLTK